MKIKILLDQMKIKILLDQMDLYQELRGQPDKQKKKKKKRPLLLNAPLE